MDLEFSYPLQIAGQLKEKRSKRSEQGFGPETGPSQPPSRIQLPDGIGLHPSTLRFSAKGFASQRARLEAVGPKNSAACLARSGQSGLQTGGGQHAPTALQSNLPPAIAALRTLGKKDAHALYWPP